MEDTITMTPEIWTILGTGFTLVALGSTGFTLLWRYITRAEQRMEARFNDCSASGPALPFASGRNSATLPPPAI